MGACKPLKATSTPASESGSCPTGEVVGVTTPCTVGAIPAPKMVTMPPGTTPGAKLAPLRNPEMVRLGPGSLLVSANDAVKLPTVAETEIGPGVAPAVTVMEALPEASVFAVAAESVALPP